MTKLLALLAGIVASHPALAEDNPADVLADAIAVQVELVTFVNDYYQTVCYGSDPVRASGGKPSPACVEVGGTFDYEMGRLNSLLGEKEAILKQAAVQAFINQADLLRSQYNEMCLSDESLQAESQGLNNDACHFVRAEYGAAVDDLTRLMHSDIPMDLCAEGDCPAKAAD
jgi:hypothetical protein